MNKINLNVNFSTFLEKIKLKKQYLYHVKNKLKIINKLKDKNYKKVNSNIYNSEIKFGNTLVSYIIDITFSKSNTLIHVMDFSGNLKFFCSAGQVNYKGKSKKSRYSVIRDLYRVLVVKLKFLKNKPIALHLKNTGSAKLWIIRLFKKKFFIKSVKSFTKYPHNGCRKKKLTRKKVKKKEWPSG
jgi:ribosomal protein S11